MLLDALTTKCLRDKKCLSPKKKSLKKSPSACSFFFSCAPSGCTVWLNEKEQMSLTQKRQAPWREFWKVRSGRLLQRMFAEKFTTDCDETVRLHVNEARLRLKIAASKAHFQDKNCPNYCPWKVVLFESTISHPSIWLTVSQSFMHALESLLTILVRQTIQKIRIIQDTLVPKTALKRAAPFQYKFTPFISRPQIVQSVKTSYILWHLC